MSYNVSEEFYYYLRGRELVLYQLLGGSTNERVSQSGVFRTMSYELMYPNENIEDGLRIEYTALDEPFVSEALETTTAYGSGINISFASTAAISVASSTSFSDFVVGDKIRVQGSTSNDGDYTIASITSTSIDGTSYSNNVFGVSSGITTEAAGERITVTQIPKEIASASVDETSHPNVNQGLCLAVVDYVKAMKAESQGDLTTKEYYIKEFYSKLGDNESNKRKMAMSFPSAPYAIR
tara:strand:- start:344 stop:1057 length:714 start_codon:yes stop_codon:yes gene_type:complete